MIDDDAKWFALLHDYYQHFKYQTIMTTDMAAFFNQHTGKSDPDLQSSIYAMPQFRCWSCDLTSRHIPCAYRWQADEKAFAMPIKVGDKDHWQIITPVTTRWQTMNTPLDRDQFEVATDLYYVNVRKS